MARFGWCDNRTGSPVQPEEDRVMVEVDFAGHVGAVRGPGHDDISDGGDMVATRYQTTVHCASLFE